MMNDDKVSALLSALKLDEHPLTNQLLSVEELNSADGSFILSGVMKHQLEKGRRVIFVLCHSSFGHFLSIGQKLGYNLQALKDAGQVCVINVLEKIYRDDYLLKAEHLRELFCEIGCKVEEWREGGGGVCVVVENVGNLLAIGERNGSEFFAFLHYLKTIAVEGKNSSVVVSVHGYTHMGYYNAACRALRHLADVTVVVDELGTGRANDVTGHFVVMRKEDNFRKSRAGYHYKLHDKCVAIFPGFRHAL